MIKVVRRQQLMKAKGIPQTLNNRIRADNPCKLSGAGARIVIPEQKELARLRYCLGPYGRFAERIMVNLDGRACGKHCMRKASKSVKSV